MKKALAALAATAATLFATAAFPENTVWEHKAQLQRMWDNSQARAAAPGDLLDRVFGLAEVRVVNLDGDEVGTNYGRNLRSNNGFAKRAWSGNFHGGRVHEPAGR